MAIWHYYDKNGEKIGPISVTALKALVQQGVITRETVIENHTGRKEIAGKVRGINFPETKTASEPPIPSVLLDKKDEHVVAPSSDGEVYGLSSPTPLAAMTPPAKPVAPPLASPFDNQNPPIPSAFSPVVDDPFAAEPEDSNPFITPPSDSSNPFITAPSVTQQSASPSVSVPVTNKLKNLPKPVIFGGIAVLLLVFLGVAWAVFSSPRYSAEERAEIDKFCAEYGTDVKAVANSGATLLHRAAQNGNIVVVKYLVSKGADVNVKPPNGNTPLHTAAVANHHEVVKFLVAKRADVNAKNARGRIPLHLVVSSAGGNTEKVQNRLEIVKFLVSKGSDVNVKDNNDMTPLDFAREGGDREIVEYLSSLKK